VIFRCPEHLIRDQVACLFYSVDLSWVGKQEDLVR